MHQEQDTPIFPDGLPSPVNLRLRALERVGKPEEHPLTRREQRTVAWIIQSDASVEDRDCPLVTYVEHDVSGLGLGRYTMIAMWLAPYSRLLSGWPATVIRVARFLLGDTTEEEMSQVPWDKIERKLGPTP